MAMEGGGANRSMIARRGLARAMWVGSEVRGWGREHHEEHEGHEEHRHGDEHEHEHERGHGHEDVDEDGEGRKRPQWGAMER